MIERRARTTFKPRPRAGPAVRRSIVCVIMTMGSRSLLLGFGFHGLNRRALDLVADDPFLSVFFAP